MFCKNCGNEASDGIDFCKHCGKKILVKQPLENQGINPSKKMPNWLKIILVILWVIVFALSMQIRKQFIVGGLVGFIHAAFFLYLLNLIIKK